MLHDLPPPTLVEDKGGFDRLLSDLERQKEIAVDTEADSFFSYHEKVCLIQITVEDRDYLLDPLAASISSSSAHARRSEEAQGLPRRRVRHPDHEARVRLRVPEPVRHARRGGDSRLAGAGPGVGAQGSLRDRARQVDAALELVLAALSDKQIRYARLDTHFLLPLMREQKRELEARGRLMIVDGECRRLEGIEPNAPDFDPDGFVRIKGARTLGPLERQVLRELFALRERLANDSDQPPFRVVNNETLIKLAQARPRSLNDLQRVPGFSWKQGRKLGDEVLEAIARGVELGPLREFPSLPARDGTDELSEEEIELHERLKNWRKARALEMEIDAGVPAQPPRAVAARA
jgi:ribonuclease D